jgi:Putative beta barrel porin-7 (BBP7)
MRKRIFTALAITFLAAAAADAQQGQQLLPPVPEPVPAPAILGIQPPPPPVMPVPGGGPIGNPAYPPPVMPGPGFGNPAYPPPVVPAPSSGPIATPLFQPIHDRPMEVVEVPQRAWVTLDFLAWWIKPGPSPNPLVTAGSANDSISGALGQPGTTVLYGGRDLNYGSFAGIRVDAGWWLPCCPNIGIEAAYIGLQQRTIGFSAFSDGNGDPVIARPVINAQTKAETSYIDSFSGAASGGVTASSASTFDSWEINAIFNMLQTKRWSWDAIVGFRSLDLTERLELQDLLIPLAAGNFSFAGGPADPPSSLWDYDCFHTGNHFYGGQLGSRLIWNLGRWDIDWTVKVALGVTQQTTTIEGASFLLTPGSPPVGASGGVLAQPTNIGRYYHSSFSVVPETGFNFGYQITPWLRAQIGYNFLYWTSVVRPGNQIDRTVNPSQVPTDASFTGLTGPARPVLVPQTSDFWTQGVNFGLEFRF